jgi:hypothetical protein
MGVREASFETMADREVGDERHGRQLRVSNEASLAASRL